MIHRLTCLRLSCNVIFFSISSEFIEVKDFKMSKKNLIKNNPQVALLRNNIITHLAQFNKSVITAPVTVGRERSNFWGDITEDGWYRRSPDYFDIIE